MNLLICSQNIIEHYKGKNIMESSEFNFEPLKLEFNQLNDYARHGFQLLVSWYTLFIAANIIAAGWFISIEQGKFTPKLLAIVVGVIFLIGNIFSIIVTRIGRKYYHKTHLRTATIAKNLNHNLKLENFEMKSPIPEKVYSV
ncbi:MAG: hypothetical protein A2475_01255 [Ignavibacteria bacterium RIFOXYC2_FULL_35_21]|nr:MAG: hypothetical protein A2220_01790 [Ignavibacteria bacterium RIFOXYA2_FULL_35_10]OGV21271.1 MAG: hypothetical protein A2475_01255 [Ignavibacteria bacterium RIFOXYC2_FULL_35_21]